MAFESLQVEQNYATVQTSSATQCCHHREMVTPADPAFSIQHVGGLEVLIPAHRDKEPVEVMGRRCGLELVLVRLG